MNSTNTSGEKNALHEDVTRLLTTIAIVAATITALAFLEAKTHVMQRLFAAPATQTNSQPSAVEEQPPQ